jgi:hypothetical protein
MIRVLRIVPGTTARKRTEMTTAKENRDDADRGDDGGIGSGDDGAEDPRDGGPGDDDRYDSSDDDDHGGDDQDDGDD